MAVVEIQTYKFGPAVAASGHQYEKAETIFLYTEHIVSLTDHHDGFCSVLLTSGHPAIIVKGSAEENSERLR
jgi:hypothetical protein